MTAVDASDGAEEIEIPAARAAGFWIRAAARTIDLIVILAGWVVVFLSLAFNHGLLVVAANARRRPDWVDHLSVGTWITLAGLLAAGAVYHAITESVIGTTLGKSILRLRVVTLDLGPPSFKAAAVRALGFLVDGFLFGLPGAYAMYRSPMRQRHGDFWAGTMVVHRSSAGYPPRPRTALFVGVNVAAMFAAGWVATMGLYLSSVLLPR